MSDQDELMTMRGYCWREEPYPSSRIASTYTSPTLYGWPSRRMNFPASLRRTWSTSRPCFTPSRPFLPYCLARLQGALDDLCNVSISPLTSPLPRHCRSHPPAAGQGTRQAPPPQPQPQTRLPHRRARHQETRIKIRERRAGPCRRC